MQTGTEIIPAHVWSDVFAKAAVIKISDLPIADPSPLKVIVVSAPLDVTSSILVPLSAAFFGALAAFLLSWLERKELKRQTRRELINKAVNSLAITSNTLINFKRQFLHEFLAEFDRAMEILSAMSFAQDEAYYHEVHREISFVFNSVAMQDQQMNSLLKPLEEIQFLNLTAADDLAFTVEGDTDVVRFLILIQSQIHQISKRIVERNGERKNMIGASQEELRTRRGGRASLMFYFEMLDSRRILREYTDLALVLIDVTVERIGKYQKKYFKRRTWLARKVFGNEKWTTIMKLTPAWQALIPDRALYSDILEGVKE